MKYIYAATVVYLSVCQALCKSPQTWERTGARDPDLGRGGSSDRYWEFSLSRYWLSSWEGRRRGLEGEQTEGQWVALGHPSPQAVGGRSGLGKGHWRRSCLRKIQRPSKGYGECHHLGILKFTKKTLPKQNKNN